MILIDVIDYYCFTIWLLSKSILKKSQEKVSCIVNWKKNNNFDSFY